jgi:succinate dehydrogenase/fumarate reductase-like Fe-S protein
MSQTHTKGETHGCIVCGKLYQLYVVYDENNKFLGGKIMSAGGRLVEHPRRALVACETHSEAEVEAAVVRVYGEQKEED